MQRTTPYSCHVAAGVHLLAMARSSATPKALLLWCGKITAGVPRGLELLLAGVWHESIPLRGYTNRCRQLA
jgi:hypothetical protein